MAAIAAARVPAPPIQDMNQEPVNWLPADANGLATAWLTDPARSSLRGKRLRRAFDRPAPLIDAWPAAWRALLGEWVRRADPDKPIRCDSLLARAGAERTNAALQLFARLLAEGLVEVEERRDPQRRDWQPHSLRFVDPVALRAALALPEPDARQRQWADTRNVALALPQLATARSALDAQPPKTALERLELLLALQRWHDTGRARGQSTRRDFAYFARSDTKKITDTEWRWLADTVDLASFGIAAHAPLLLIAADSTLSGPAGALTLGALPGFVGLPPQGIHAVTLIAPTPSLWRVVENRSAFEKAAATRAANEAVLWLPGYPPGWWLEAVGHLLALASAPLAIACDPDPDGIAIALQAARLWEAAGQPWAPWHMRAEDLTALAHRRTLSDRDRNLLQTLETPSLPTELRDLVAAMLTLGEKGEQESLFWQDASVADTSSAR